MKRNQEGFSLVEGLLVIIALTLIVGVGYYVMSSNKDKKDQVATTTASTTKSTPTQSTTPQQSQKSDEELIKEALKSAYGSEMTSETTITVSSVQGDNAQGNVFTPDDGGYAFIAHKADGKWTIVYRGQEAPGKDIGEKYNLPSAWYNHS